MKDLLRTNAAVISYANCYRRTRAYINTKTIIQILGVLALGARVLLGVAESTVVSFLNTRCSRLAVTTEPSCTNARVPIRASVDTIAVVKVLGVLALGARVLLGVAE